jgi:hypothetical protein
MAVDLVQQGPAASRFRCQRPTNVAKRTAQEPELAEIARNR